MPPPRPQGSGGSAVELGCESHTLSTVPKSSAYIGRQVCFDLTQAPFLSQEINLWPLHQSHSEDLRHLISMPRAFPVSILLFILTLETWL